MDELPLKHIVHEGPRWILRVEVSEEHLSASSENLVTEVQEALGVSIVEVIDQSKAVCEANRWYVDPFLTQKAEDIGPMQGKRLANTHAPAHQLQALRLELVRTPRERLLYRQMMVEHHSLGYYPMPGAQLRYLLYNGSQPPPNESMPETAGSPV